MKIFAGILVILICALLGYLFAEKYLKRKKFYDDFYSFNILLKNEISFNQKTLVEIVKSLDGKSYFNHCVKEYVLNALEFIDANFDKSEIDIIQSYFSMIGRGDKKSQLDYLNEIENELKDKKNDCENDYKKRYSLYVKLGILVGIIFFIVII